MTEPVDLHATTDASVWAREFVRLNPGADEGLMLAWMANAIETGRSAGLAEGESRAREAAAEVATLRDALNRIRVLADLSVEEMRERYGSEMRVLMAVIPSIVDKALEARQPEQP